MMRIWKSGLIILKDKKMDNNEIKISGTFWICLWLCLILFSLDGIRTALEKMVKQNETRINNKVMNAEK